MTAIEDTVRQLLDDPNVPPVLATHAVARALAEWRDGTLPERAAEFVPQFVERLSADFLLQGPPARMSETKVRVSRIMSGSTLMEHYLRQSALGPAGRSGTSFKFGGARVRHNAYPWKGHRGVTWVAMTDELGSSSADEVADNLGLTHLLAEPVVAITYSLPASDLHVPTVFDAFGSPYFAAKHDIAEPRAWNWRHHSAGFVEFVHGPDASVDIDDVEVRLLGRPQLPPVSSPFATLKLPSAERVASAVRAAIRRLDSRTAIEAFLDDRSDFLHLLPREFEEFLGVLFTISGYDAKVTQATRDGGFDVIAVKDDDTGEQLLLQAKKTEGTIGVSVIRELAGARHFAGPSFATGILVVATTGKFSLPARQLERQNASELRLHDYNELKAMTEAAKGVTVEQIALDAVNKARRS